MKNKNESPLYATLLYEVRRKLDISIQEYFYLDMVYHLSHDGWCYKSLESIARDMGITKRGVMKMRDRLIERKLLKKNIKGHVKTTVMYNSVLRSDNKSVNKVPLSVNKVHPSGELSSTKNNNRITKNKSLSEMYFDKYFPKRVKDMPDLGVDY
jgi:hypothetical protein